MIKRVDVGGGVLVDYTHKREVQHIVYASATSPGMACLTITVNGVMVDCVYVGGGGSHSWWGVSNGPLVPGGALKKGDHLVITATDICAIRIDDIDDQKES